MARQSEILTTAAFSPSGEYVAIVAGDSVRRGRLVAAGTYADGTATLVNVASGAIRSQIQVSMFGCGSMAFSPDGRYLITPSNGGLLNNGKHDRGGSIRVFRVTE